MSSSPSTLLIAGPRQTAPGRGGCAVVSRRQYRPEGSALMLVMAAIILMSVSVMGVVEFMRYSLEEEGVASRDFQAMHLAESGIALGLSPQLQPGDPVLKQQVGTDSGFEVVISSEGARIPLVSLSDENMVNGIYELFVDWGLSPNEARTVADSLADWVDSDDEARSQGAESDYYEGLGYTNFPRQQDFTSLEELLLVRGMNLVEAVKPDWRNYFSVHGDGFMDLNFVPREILVAVFGAQESHAENLIRERNGADGLPNTEDDVKLSSSQIRSLLGMDEARYTELSPLITEDHLTRRIESTGRIGESTYKITVIARRQTDGSLNYLARLEE